MKHGRWAILNFVPVTIIRIDIWFVVFYLKMKVPSESYRSVNLEEMLFKINKVYVL